MIASSPLPPQVEYAADHRRRPSAPHCPQLYDAPQRTPPPCLPCCSWARSTRRLAPAQVGGRQLPPLLCSQWRSAAACLTSQRWCSGPHQVSPRCKLLCPLHGWRCVGEGLPCGPPPRAPHVRRIRSSAFRWPRQCLRSISSCLRRDVRPPRVPTAHPPCRSRPAQTDHAHSPRGQAKLALLACSQALLRALEL